jgi:hypothetical protein
MSKTLRRPMFRGGRVDSRGTGITSGLDEGYATGGRVGYRDGPDMYGVQPIDVSKQQQDYYDFIKEYGGGEYLEPGAVQDIYGKQIINLKEKTKPANFFEFAGSVLNPFQKTYGGVSRFGEQKNLEYATSPAGKAAYESEIEKKRKQQAEMILANPKLAPDKIDLARQILGRDDVKSEITGLEPQLPPQRSRKDEILEEAALYREALGYDEAKSQAVYDALGAGAPAVFQGKNLREAAPKVFEAINKSEAFQKPLSVKQAAGQLAIQRRMLADKAKAEEAARLAIYGMKNRESLTDLVKGIPGSFVAGVLPKGVEKNPTLQATLRPGGIYSTEDGDYFYAVPSTKGDRVTGLQRLG